MKMQAQAGGARRFRELTIWELGVAILLALTFRRAGSFVARRRFLKREEILAR